MAVEIEGKKASELDESTVNALKEILGINSIAGSEIRIDANSAYAKIQTVGNVLMESLINADWDKWLETKYNFGIDTALCKIFNQVNGTLQIDGMVSLRGSANNRTWGKHIFHGWNVEDTYRLSMMSGYNQESESCIQMYNPLTHEFGIVRLGSDYSAQGTVFKQYDIDASGDLTFVASANGVDTKIQRVDSAGSIQISGGSQGNPTKGAKIKINGAGQATNPAGIILSFGCTWKADATQDGTDTSIVINYVSLTQNIDIAKFTRTGMNLMKGDLILTEIGTYADNAAAVTAGKPVNTVYKTSTGELRIVV